MNLFIYVYYFIMEEYCRELVFLIPVRQTINMYNQIIRTNNDTEAGLFNGFSINTTSVNTYSGYGVRISTVPCILRESCSGERGRRKGWLN